MPIYNVNNDQNIIRGVPKMSEDFPHEINAKLTSTDHTEYFDGEEECDDGSYDHMYASSNDHNDQIDADATTCQSTESEVKFLKEWLILHLDLIQQQNDDILDKEKTILILQQENLMLKERLNCIEEGGPYPLDRPKHQTKPEYLGDRFVEDMTQDSGPFEEEDKGKMVDLLGYQADDKLPEDGESRSKDDQTSKRKSDNGEVKLHNYSGEGGKVTECGYDAMRHLRMSIRRKRGYSNSSALSNNDSLISFGKFKKKRRRYTKDVQIMTTSQSYVTQVGHSNSTLPPDPDVATDYSTTLEVPRWRIKAYGSCYTMEGTENLDDEVFNKRHLRLENDERRRKRWDVQRIREQRVIEKLKLRQERVGSGSRSDEQNECVASLWSSLEDLKFLEIVKELPVSAFGAPIPRLNSTGPASQHRPWNAHATANLFNDDFHQQQPQLELQPAPQQQTNEFHLPWLGTSQFNNQNPKQPNNSKKLTVKRRSLRR